ncbi:hypothetical protein H6770_04160 [Candidatus Peribacteria bacterium]|nr:hypothetical protein [Candidatus Peribacteria bacterium]
MSRNSDRSLRIRSHIEAANLANQMRGTLALLNDLHVTDDAFQQQMNVIRSESLNTYEAVRNALSQSQSVAHERETILERTTSTIADVIAEYSLPVTHRYIDDIVQGEQYILAQDFHMLFDGEESSSAAQAINIRKGTTLFFPSSPAREIQIETKEILLTLPREMFPASGILVRRQKT